MAASAETLSGRTSIAFAATTTTAIAGLVWFFYRMQCSAWSDKSSSNSTKMKKTNNLVVNYHFHRRCNYSCKFCFHTSTNGTLADLSDAQRAMKLLRDEGMIRVNFSGGEPFLQAKWLGAMCQYSHELGVTVSIVSNGSKITDKWMKQFGQYVDVLAISCDSFDPETLRKIGRYEPKKDHLAQLDRVRDWCEQYNIIFKINSVICRANHHENMVGEILRLKPARWKVFQCLLIDGENAGDPDSLRDARDQVITKEEFDAFVERHREMTALVPEDNDTMRNSYLILDESLKFLNNQHGDKRPSSVTVLENVVQALRESGFDVSTFKDRGGEWCNPKGQELEW
mmetsp:Transcript_12151/g.21361  ORF Transcript_12151/g.21361 Transcript_12151/m.21361 type:complete len:341 (-) Transcript_12151:118-1140(-)|eukprot:CAMPEP_0178791224 /NCGR_PEP_ID=MMETSP0745-20121128/7876_1 /TAXON_ID=913974 /ORGANISM="Nitzschia punctata, Strain CCMP561" /LENGTH=340 /DNA_ID=CAMNT_0020449331 /DNA_START=24 /DNA_END=1046 /DNA_ORIENTATION=+